MGEKKPTAPNPDDTAGPGRYQDAMMRFAFALCLTLVAALPARAERATVAVAANFTEPAREIATAFEAASGHEIVLSFGSTGQLFAQIAQGAPFDVFLAADRERPARAESDGLAVVGSRITYALGRLALYSRAEGRASGPESLRDPPPRRLAIANPRTAPYGAAALAVLDRLGLTDAMAGRIVEGANVAQAFQFAATGNADLAFVALSQAASAKNGSYWPVPASMHPPIAQDAVLLTRGAENAAAAAFLSFLRKDAARTILRAYGYEAAE